jgi:hypothetical protein
MTQSRGFGTLRRLPSGRYQASYAVPDLRRHTAPTTFETKLDAEGWLRDEHRMIERDEWAAPAARSQMKHRPLLLPITGTSLMRGRYRCTSWTAR